MHNNCKQEFIVFQIVNLFCYNITKSFINFVVFEKKHSKNQSRFIDQFLFYESKQNDNYD